MPPKIRKGGLECPSRKGRRRPVPTCHPKSKLYARELCRKCYEKWLRQTNPAFAERQRKNCRLWVKNYADKKRKSDKKWLAKQDTLYRWARHLKSRFGITPEEYYKMLASQKGVCNICERSPKPSKRLAIDHCHKTGKIRGLLCFRCNYGLTFFSESEKMLLKAASHVKV